MGPRLRLSVGLTLAAACAVGWLAVPRRFEVEGVSMGPALLPGDVVRTGMFPALHRLRRPRRFERWVLAATDGLAIKRVVGLPHDEVVIVDGDLAIDGEVVLKNPRLLAEMGSVVADTATAGPPPAAGWSWSRPGGEILDDAGFDPGVARVLVPVRDAGLVAVLDVRQTSAADPAAIRVRVGDTVVARRLTEPGRSAVVAGRLDGRLVVAAWRVPQDAPTSGRRSCLPAAAPEAWQVADPWPGSVDDDSAPALAIDADDDRVTIAALGRWRDVAWRPGADGRSSWQLGIDEVLVLGDHPAASTDSRRWGPIQTAALRYRVASGIHSAAEPLPTSSAGGIATHVTSPCDDRDTFPHHRAFTIATSLAEGPLAFLSFGQRARPD